jgi:hypothetical protein
MKLSFDLVDSAAPKVGKGFLYSLHARNTSVFFRPWMHEWRNRIMSIIKPYPLYSGCGTTLPLVRIYFALILQCLFLATAAQADKVKLDKSEWGKEGGEDCISCHRKTSPGLESQWHDSEHNKAGMNCLDCHQADTADDDAITHEGEVISTIVSPKDCGRCHTTEYQQQKGSVHANAATVIEHRVVALENVGGPAIVAAGCDQCHGSTVKVKGDGTLDSSSWPNSGIGRINPDGSRGSCSSCHGRHRFSKAQARDPGACMRCHSGPDSPDREVYEASKHGMHFTAERDQMNLTSDQWRAGKEYGAAPTCVTCHMAAAGKIKRTHDVGMRSSWKLNTPVSEKQYLVVFEDGDKLNLPVSRDAPKKGDQMAKLDGSMGTVKAVASPKRRRQAMSKVCLECHSKPFAKNFMKQFDDVVELYNEKFGKPAQAIMQALYSRGKLTPLAFDEPLEFTYWELWHDEGARARHGAAMASPNHTWWEGIYEVGRNFYTRFLPQVRAAAGEDLGRQLIDEHVNSVASHQWLQAPGKANPILGYGIGGQSHEAD